ncbi:hypothetical protein L3Y34_019516 [Caenorhabditis briggsae]|uniref:Uncharacterized protein n=1 Tax=Caenorhabditis briggsae TaxID=6238 RepID=A0AAE9IWS5_CAEBR|nr:hypothetical protein L3Y34_019516 [Caenorhabditis briggsae]
MAQLILPEYWMAKKAQTGTRQLGCVHHCFKELKDLEIRELENPGVEMVPPEEMALIHMTFDREIVWSQSVEDPTVPTIQII